MKELFFLMVSGAAHSEVIDRIPLHAKLVFRRPFFCSQVNIEMKVGHGDVQIKVSFRHKFCLFSSCC